MTNQEAPSDFFNPANEAKSVYMKFTKVGDWIKGTLTSKRTGEAKGPYAKPGEMVTTYELKVHGGCYHELDELKQVKAEPVMLKEGDFVLVSKASIDIHMRKAALGQIIGLRFADSIPSKTKGYNPAKRVSVILGGQDPNYMGESAADSVSADDTVVPPM